MAENNNNIGIDIHESEIDTFINDLREEYSDSQIKLIAKNTRIKTLTKNLIQIDQTLQKTNLEKEKLIEHLNLIKAIVDSKYEENVETTEDVDATKQLISIKAIISMYNTMFPDSMNENNTV